MQDDANEPSSIHMGDHIMSDTSGQGSHEEQQHEMGANGNMMNHTDTMHGNQTSEEHKGGMDNDLEDEGDMPGMNMTNHGRFLMEEDMTMETHGESSATETVIYMYPRIYKLDDMGHPVSIGDNQEYAPGWQVSPAPTGTEQSLVNFDLLTLNRHCFLWQSCATDQSCPTCKI